MTCSFVFSAGMLFGTRHLSLSPASYRAASSNDRSHRSAKCVRRAPPTDTNRASTLMRETLETRSRKKRFKHGPIRPRPQSSNTYLIALRAFRYSSFSTSLVRRPPDDFSMWAANSLSLSLGPTSSSSGQVANSTTSPNACVSSAGSRRAKASEGFLTDYEFSGATRPS